MRGATEIVVHTTKRRSPTGQNYGEFMRAYRFFNKALFENALPDCMITLHRHRSAYGYFSPDRYESGDGEITDEIAMNPDHLRKRPDRVALSTLVHEMIHLWQHRAGKPSRTGYHNREWADKMESLGLMPSNTGRPGGKRTGQNMTHYIIDRGPYDRACEQLLATGFKISWGAAPAPPKKTKSGSRVKYTCVECSASVWGKAELDIGCNACGTTMEAED